MAATGAIISLDIGSVRTGVAISRPPVHIPTTLMTVSSEHLVDSILQIITDEQVVHVVAGLPRNMSGVATDQTAFVKDQVAAMQQKIAIPITFFDEAATSVKAEEELAARKKSYKKEDIDMLAAVYILEDYMRDHPEIIHV